MRTYVQPGKEINFVAGATIKSGDAVVIGELVGIAAADYVSGQTGVAELEGVHKLKKTAALAISQGARCYFDTAAKEVNVTNTGKFIGFCFSAAISADAVVQVKLSQPGA